jgi:transposase
MVTLPNNLRPTTLAEALEVIAQLLQVIAQQQEGIAALEARVAELEERLRQNSQNSSRPPSADPPTVVRAPRAPSKRQPGGQPGHAGYQRALVPPEQVDRVVPVKPRYCRRCGGRLAGAVGVPVRHQVMEVPPVRPHVTEYQLHTLWCEACKVTTTATVPPGVPVGAFGPRLQAIAAVCTGVYHLSRRTTVEVLRDLLGVPMSVGALSACEQALSAAVAPPVGQAHEYVRQHAEVRHADETGWRERRRRAWLWVVVSPLVTVFMVHAQRSTAAARALLGTCLSAILITDRWSAYQYWATEHRQLCWAHLVREFRAFTVDDHEKTQNS